MSRFGQYTLERRIAFGGMAEIWLAHAEQRAVALKRILPQLSNDADYRELFLEEIRIAARLKHPNIVDVLDMGEVDGVPYLVMEYVDGGTLPRTLPPGLTALAGSKVARALDYAHRLGDASGRSLAVVHRDVSPPNVLISSRGEVKLIDFGVARASPQVFAGRPRYLSPEVVDGAAPSPKSDQFALGTVLWERVAGRPLFGSSQALAELERVRLCHVPPLGTAPQLERVLLKALEKNPAARWPDCGAMAQALEDVLMEIDGPTSPAELAAHLRG